jgi:hypothetical protein
MAVIVIDAKGDQYTAAVRRQHAQRRLQRPAVSAGAV